ncbi:RNA polymerase sigma factor [Kitasatospora sp. NPDC093679]|uniref:RNA polymerase sigma factor n=1 Tax=Kitasatospora sp. NPDC093679 TaxID=3154983 RepID=UPI00343BDC4F
MTTPFSGNEQELSDPLGELPLDFTGFFLEEHTKWLIYAKSRLGNRQDAEDAVQDAGATLYAKWHTALRCPDLLAVRAFAWKVVRDRVIDLLRTRSRRAKVERFARQEVEVTSEEELNRLVEREALTWAMGELTKVRPIHAEVVRLRQLRMDYAQIGAVLDIAPSTAKTYYSLGWHHLQYLLDPQRDQQEGHLT